jgi:hypothetical protein
MKYKSVWFFSSRYPLILEKIGLLAGSGSEKLRGYMAVVEACHFHLSNNVDRVHVGNLCGEQLQAHLESRCDAF